MNSERSNCAEKLAQLQKNLKNAEDAAAKVKPFDGMGYYNAINEILARTKEYKKEYERCH
jgi:hypothetical protein